MSESSTLQVMVADTVPTSPIAASMRLVSTFTVRVRQ
jgi:hypothetical protein